MLLCRLFVEEGQTQSEPSPRQRGQPAHAGLPYGDRP
jgi:hypothetical protein